MIDINNWINRFLKVLNDTFGERVWFIRLAVGSADLFRLRHPERSRTPNAVRSKRSVATFGI